MPYTFLSNTNVNKRFSSRAPSMLDSQKSIRSQEIHRELEIRNYISVLDQMKENSPHWAQTDQNEKAEGTNHVLNLLSVDKSRD